MGIGEALAGGFRLTRQRLPHLAVYAAIAFGAPLLVYALLKWSFGEVPSLTHAVKRWNEAQTHDPAALLRELRLALPAMGVSWGAGLIGWVTTAWGQSFLQRSCVTFPDAKPEAIRDSARITSERFARVLAVDLMSIVGVYVGLALCCLPAVAVALVTYAVDVAILFKNRTVSAAFRDSFRTARRNIPALLVLIVCIIGLGFALNFLASKLPGSTLDPQLVEALVLCVNRLLIVPLSLGTVYVYLRAGPPEAAR